VEWLGRGDGEADAVIPEPNFELGAGFGEAEKGIIAVTTDVAAGAGSGLVRLVTWQQRMSFSIEPRKRPNRVIFDAASDDLLNARSGQHLSL
jgi:hypothetical protein